MNYFSSNSIQSVELTSEGDLNLKYDKGGQKTIKNSDIPVDLQKLVENMKKDGTKKLTKEELEQKLAELEKQRKQLEQGEKEPKKSGGLWPKVGIGALVVAVLVGLTALVIRNKKIKNKK